jgi:glycosyltransferase involved in cell wall biosynthesis
MECINYPKHEYTIFLRDNIASQLEMNLFPENFSFVNVTERPGKSIFQVWKSNRWFDKLAKEIKPDVVISTGGHGFWKPNVPVVGGFNIPHYIYPESPYFNRIGLKKRGYWWLKKRFDLFFYRRLDAIVAQTEDVKQRLQKLTPGVPIHTVSNTINGAFMDAKNYPPKLPQKGKNEIRLLTVSSYYPHKNLDVIFPILQELEKQGRHDIKFALTLPEENFREFSKDYSGDLIYNVGPIPINEVPSLYDECDMMFLPTLLECFSASYAEAMAKEKPILTSDLGFAHTVCGDAAVYFNPTDPKDIADKIIYLSDNPEVRDQLIQSGKKALAQLNTPKERAEKFLEIGLGLVEK